MRLNDMGYLPTGNTGTDSRHVVGRGNAGFSNESLYPKARFFEFTYVWLKKNIERAHFFYCPQCQNPVLRYQGQVVAIVPAGVNAMSTAAELIMNFPIETRCTNKNCPAKYLFEGWAIEDDIINPNG